MINTFRTTVQPPTIEGRPLTALLTVSHTWLDALTSMPTALLPILQAQFGLTETLLGLLVATLSFSASVTQPFFGALADRYGQRVVLSVGLIANAVLISSVGIVSSVAVLFMIFLLGGLGSGAMHPAGASLVRDTTKGNKSLAVSIFSTGGTLGVAFGPIVILYIATSFGLHFMPWLMIPGILLGAVLLMFAPRRETVTNGPKRSLFDTQVILGPVGLLSLAGVFSGIAFITFTSAVPLWLVAEHGVAPNSPLIGWTLGAFSLAAALGGMVAAALYRRVRPSVLISSTLALAPVPLIYMFGLQPGTLPYFATIVLAGALVYASVPLMVVTAQGLAPQAMATASGMLMGFSSGLAGILYIGVSRLQEAVGLVPAMQVTYLTLLPASLIALYVLARTRRP